MPALVLYFLLHCTIKNVFSVLWSFPDGSEAKESACNAGDPVLIPGSGSSLKEGNDYLLQYSSLLHREFHGQRSLAGYSPWDCKESNMTEELTVVDFLCLFFCLFV